MTTLTTEQLAASRARADQAETRVYLAQQSVYAEEPYEIALDIIKPLAGDVLALLVENERLTAERDVLLAELAEARGVPNEVWHSLTDGLQ